MNTPEDIAFKPPEDWLLAGDKELKGIGIPPLDEMRSGPMMCDCKPVPEDWENAIDPNN